jgi:septum formation protein
MVESLALQKARHVAKQLSRGALRLADARSGDTWVLGADTLVFLKGRVLGKPSSPAAGRRMLRALSGAWHRVYTGVALVQGRGAGLMVGHQVTWVKMKRLSFRQVDRASRHHLDKAGAYAIQESNDPFVEALRGDYDNVVGLPLRLVGKFLRRAGFPLARE